MVVQKVQHREIYEVTEVDEVSEEIESRNNFNIETNQDNSSNEATLVVGEELEISQLCRLDVEHQHINMSNAQVELARDAQSFLNDEDEDIEIDSDTDDQISLSDDSAMPPKRIEHLPVLETPIDDSSSRGRPIRRETRGTHSDRLRRQISDRGRLPVTFRQSDGHPIGPNAASFMTELGLSIKKFAPLQAKSWNHILAENKRMIYDRISDDMVRLRDECILSQNPEDGIDVLQIVDTVCDQVLGTRSGYIRGLGSGPKPVRSTSSDATSSSRSTNAALRERFESTQDELANTKIQLANTQDELASIKSRQNMFEQILNRLAPGALDSLIQDSSSAPPPPPPS
ncbi:hypothetical protein ZIOFF_048151 [Zingiber officinale]|uniref:Uncharacterized protein n=1 Tax=Zingiber officinale TaxID=94328 RepID=A0A8J5KXE6_ZINOF|nr:hypothetical protein ZIOFF_048151 [Zingiber officinale]